MNDTTATPEQPTPASDQVQRATKANLLRVVPTDRVSFKKQVEVLRAYAAASGTEKSAVSYGDVASVIGLVASSVALVTPFLVDTGLLMKDGNKFRPADAVFDYIHALEWNSETAGTKLIRPFADSWAGKVLTPRLAFRQLTKDEAIAVLAEESRASKAHRPSLETLLDFLNLAGVVRMDGNAVMKGAAGPAATPKQEHQDPKHEAIVKPPAGGTAEHVEAQPDVEKFIIPIPGKPPATVLVPRNLDADDWEMVQTIMATYITRMRKEVAKSTKG